MTRGRPHGRHTRARLQEARRGRRVALLSAPLVAGALVAGGSVVVHDVHAPDTSRAAETLSAARPTLTATPQAVQRSARVVPVSRSVTRTALPRAPKAVRTMWTTSDVMLRTTPRPVSGNVGDVKADRRIGVTGRHSGDYAEVVVGRAAWWVTARYLSPKKVVDPAQQPLSDAPCPDGSGIEAGLQPQSVKVYRAVCHAFPVLSSYGGQDGHGEHVNGEAIDFMVPSSTVGNAVKDFLYAHRAELDLFDIIWEQHIWTIQRSGEGFRSMEDRGSPTANHMDHVHIKINM